MAFITADRVKDTSTTTGTGNITVSGSAPFGYRTFSTVLSVSDTFYYCVTGQGSSEWEVGLGTYLSVNTFARTTVLASSASGSAVSFSSGTKNVFITLPANKTLQLDAAASPTAGAILYGTGSMLAYTAVGTSGQFLQSTGSGAPTWAPIGSVGTSISNGTSNVNIASSNGAVTVATNGTTAVTVDTSQNVGIGTTSPVTKLSVTGGVITDTVASGNAGINLVSTGGSGRAYGWFSNNSDGSFSAYDSTASAERMRINSNGAVIVGTSTTTTATNVTRFETIGTTGGGVNDWSQCVRWNGSGGLLLRAVASSATALYFESGAGGTLGSSAGTNVGSITVTSTNTAFNTSSDYRLKYDAVPLTKGLQTICLLKPSSYKWKIDDSAGDGFIAHELAEVIPNAVHGEKDAINEDGSIKTQGVDYSKIVVHLVAAIQELSAKNDALEVRLAALETK